MIPKPPITGLHSKVTSLETVLFISVMALVLISVMLPLFYYLK